MGFYERTLNWRNADLNDWEVEDSNWQRSDSGCGFYWLTSKKLQGHLAFPMNLTSLGLNLIVEEKLYSTEAL